MFFWDEEVFFFNLFDVLLAFFLSLGLNTTPKNQKKNPVESPMILWTGLAGKGK